MISFLSIKINIKNKKNFISYFRYSFLFLFFFVYSILSYDFDNTNKIKLALYGYCDFTDKKKIKEYDEITIPILHQGNLYHFNMSPYFGGYINLTTEDDNNSYYIVISEKINFSFDNKSLIKGYQIYSNKNTDKEYQAKMYSIKLEISLNNKNDITYNWNIQEIPLKTTNIPENAIIIYSNPEHISLESFDETFDTTYPSAEKKFIILPQLKIHEDAFKKNLNYNSLSIDAGYNHLKIKAN